MAGRKAFFTREEIFSAANELESQNEEPTIRAVREMLGGGSYGSVVRYLKEWRASKTTEDIAKSEMPPAVSSAFENAWRSARAEAAKELAFEREKCAKRVDEADQQASEAIAALEDIEARNAELSEQLDETTEKLKRTIAQLNETTSERNALSAVNSQLRVQIDKLEKSLENLQINQERLQNRQAEDLARINKNHADEISELNKEHSDAMSNLKIETSALNERLASAKTQNELLERERNEAKTEKDKSVQLIEVLRKEKEEFAVQTGQVTGQLEALKQQNSDLLARLANGLAPTED